MSDPQEPTTDQSVEPNEASTTDLSAIQTALMAEFDKRFQGFQGLLDRRTSEFQSALEELKTADLSPEEQAQFTSSKEKERIARLERENELLKMRRNFPEEVDLLEDFFTKSSLEEQLALLATFRKAQAATEPQEGEADGQPTPVDKNNPPRRQQVSMADMSGGMTKELADQVLSTANERGLFARLRRG